MSDYDAIRSATDQAESADTTEDAAFAQQISDLQAQNATLTKQLSDKQKELDAYKQSHPDAPTPTPTTRFPGDPGLGNMYVGESIGGGDPSSREKQWSATVGAYRSYFQWNQNQAIADRAKRDLDAGRLPYISFHSAGAGSWADITKGNQDAVLKDLLSKLGALNGPVWLCMDHEPVDDTQRGTAADFGAANKRIMGMLPKNVALVPTLQTAPFDPTVGGGQNIAPWYPDGSYTFVGLDTYNHRYYVPTPGNKYRDPTTVLSVLDLVRKQLNKPDVPIAIAEFGTRTDPANPGKAAQWLKDFAAQAKTKNVPAIAYFDSALNVNDRGTPWTLDFAGDGTDGKERVNAYGPLVKSGAHL